MTTQAFLLMDKDQADAVLALWDSTPGVSNVEPFLINNPLADQLGLGTLNDGLHYVAPARILSDPAQSRYLELCSTFPIYVMDSDTIFPPPEDI